MKVITIISLSLLITSKIFSQTELQASSKVIVDDGYDHAEIAVNEVGGSHGIFFGAKVNYTVPDLLWNSGNAVYAKNAGAYGYGAFSMGYIANGGDFSFYDGGLSTGANNPVSWNTVMTFKRGGKIGIGTTNFGNGDYKLYVESGIRTKKVRVDVSGWADFVFDQQYKLRPLQEVETFIKKNKHLPDVPSAKEAESNGIDLGESHTLLLRKIEELTLYLIEVNKKVESLSNENKELKKQFRK